MRISDWSSDVCSADLVAQQGQRVARVEAERRVELVLAAEAPACADPRLFGGLEQQVGADLVARIAVDDGQHGGIARGIARVRLRLCKRIRCGAKGRSAQRRVGKECGSTCRSRGWTYI